MKTVFQIRKERGMNKLGQKVAQSFLAVMMMLSLVAANVANSTITVKALDETRYAIKDESGDWVEAPEGTTTGGQLQISSDGGTTWRTSVYELLNRGMTVSLNGALLSSSDPDADAKWLAHNDGSNTVEYIGDASNYIDFPELVGMPNMAYFGTFSYLNIDLGAWFLSSNANFSDCNVIISGSNSKVNTLSIRGEAPFASLTIDDSTQWSNLKYVGASSKDNFSKVYSISNQTNLTRVMSLKDGVGNFVTTEEIIEIVGQSTYDSIPEIYAIASSMDELKEYVENNMQTPFTGGRSRVRIQYSVDSSLEAELGAFVSFTVNVIASEVAEAKLEDGIFKVTGNSRRDYPAVNVALSQKVADNAVKTVNIENFNMEIDFTSFAVTSSGSATYPNSTYSSATESFEVATENGTSILPESSFSLKAPVANGYFNNNIDLQIDEKGIGHLVLYSAENEEFRPKGLADQEARDKYKVVTTENADGTTSNLLVKEQSDGSFKTADPVTGTVINEEQFVEDDGTYKEVVGTLPGVDGSHDGYVTQDGSIHLPATDEKYVPNEDGSYTQVNDGTNEGALVIIGNEEEFIPVEVLENGTFEDTNTGDKYYPIGDGTYVVQDPTGSIALPDGTQITDAIDNATTAEDLAAIQDAIDAIKDETVKEIVQGALDDARLGHIVAAIEALDQTSTPADFDAIQDVIDAIKDEAKIEAVQASLDDARLGYVVAAIEALDETSTKADFDAIQDVIDAIKDEAKIEAVQVSLDDARLGYVERALDAIDESSTLADLSAIQDVISTIKDEAKKEAVQSDLNAIIVGRVLAGIDELFDVDGKILPTVAQTDIDAIQAIIDVLDDSSAKTEIQRRLDAVTTKIEVEEAIKDLLDAEGNLKDDVKQDAIDDLQDIIDALPEGTIKDGLQEQLDALKEKIKEKFDIVSESGVVITSGSYDLELLSKGVEFTDYDLVTWTIEVLGGFPGSEADYAELEGATISMIKSGIVKVTAEYDGYVATIIIVSPGDVDRNDRLNSVDIARLVDFVESGATNPTLLGVSDEYSIYLSDMDLNGRINTIDIAVLVNLVEGGN